MRRIAAIALGGLTLPAFLATAADIRWQGGAASYNTSADWVGGVVPGTLDNAINDYGTGNPVQINLGDPDWTVGQIRAGNSAGNGAFVQNGQTVTVLGTNYNGPVITEFFTPFRLGIVAADTGVYTLNGGTLNYGTGPFNIGEVGTGTLNITGGSIVGSGNLGVNSGGIAVPNPAVVTATAGHGLYLGDYTYYEVGYSTSHPTTGLPAAGTTITSVTQGDHSYNMPPSYTANNAVILDAAVPTATITLSTPKVCSALSFMGSAGNGPVTNTYTVHYASGANDTGTLIVPDWFGSGQEVLNVEGRVDGTGVNFQYPGSAGGNSGNAPYLLSVDISLVNTDKVVSIDLSYVGGNGNSYATATLMAVSGQDISGNSFTPLAITGYNADVVVEASAPSPFVSPSVVDTATQTGGAVNITGGGQLFIGNAGTGVYNLSGGSVDGHNYMVIGRSSGNGTLNMTGGTFNQDGGGNILVGTGYNNNGNTCVGVLNQSGGTINDQSQFLCPENSPATGTYTLSGTGTITVGSWFVIGRGGATGVMNMSGGTVNANTTDGGANFEIGEGSSGTLTQTGGSITVINQTWIGQSGGANGTYNMGGGSFDARSWFSIGRNGGTGTINLTGGSLLMDPANNGNFSIGGDGGANGTLTQSGGTFTNLNTTTWLGQGGGNGTWNMNGGLATLGLLQFCEGGNGSGNLNLNGGVISASEVNCGGAGGSGTLTFNGGTLRASGNNANFLHGIGNARFDSGGVTIDSQGFNVTVAQALADYGGGGLTKQGSGTLTLTGANSYTGNTVISAGTLAVNTATTTSSGHIVANGAGLSVQVVGAADTQISAPSLTFSSSATTLTVDLNALHPTVNAPLNVTGALAVNGTVTVNILDAAPAVGTFPLIKYGSKTGSGSFVLGTLPSGMQATLVNNTGNSSIDLHVTQTVATPRWDGSLAGGLWDINNTANWYDIGSLPALVRTVYKDGMVVLMDDNAANPNVVLNTTVNPKSLTVNDNSLNYTLAGTGKITGTNGLVKQGAATLTIQNTGGNDYTGATTISGGTVSVASLANGGSPSAIGASTASPANLVLANGALSYTGPTVTINRGYTLQGTNGTIDTQGNLALSGSVAVASGTGFTKTGAAQLAYVGVGTNLLSGADYFVQGGTVVLDGSAGGQTNTVSGGFRVVGPTGATVILTNTTLNDNDNAIGNVANTAGSMTVSTNSTVNVNSWCLLGDSVNGVATLNLNGGTLNVPNGRLFLCSAPGTMATLNINGGVINKSGDYFAVVNGGWNGNGSRTGVVNQVSGIVNSSSECWIGDGGGTSAVDSLGIYNLSGGTMTVNNWFGIGRDGSVGVFNMTGGTLNKGVGGDMVIGRGGSHGTFTMSGGTFTKDNVNPLIVGQGAGVGELDQSGGSITTTGEYWLGVDNGTIATNNISGTAQMTVHNWVTIGRSGMGVVNMTGGQFYSDNQPFIVGIWGGSQGLWNQSAGSLYVNQDIWIGQGDNNAYGTLNLSGGTITNTGWIAIGREGSHGVLNISGGTMVKAGVGNNISIAHNGGGSGDVFLSGTGTFLCLAGETWVGENGAPGTWTMNGGTAVLGVVHLAQNADATGVLTLNAGSLTAAEISTGNTGATRRELDFNGGRLIAATDNTNFIHDLTVANVQSGGALFDTAGHTVYVNQALVDAGGGSLTKVGNGTLNLNGVNTYTGTTTVSAGTLGGSGAIAGPVVVSAGATLSPGNSIGTLTLGSTLNLAGGSTTLMELNKGLAINDAVVGASAITYGGTLVIRNLGGTLQVNDTFTLFGAGSYSGSFASIVSQTPGQTVTWDVSQLAVNGTVKVTGVTAAPTTLHTSVSGGNLTLSWPVGQTGWQLQEQTNPLSTGLGTNWVTLPGSTATNQITVPVTGSTGATFFRLSL